MKDYLVFFIMAAATVASPGPGVVLTLSNALRYGFFNTFSGIFGVACGAAVVAGISATSVGLILASSTLAFTLMKYLGAAYLVYLGVKLLRAAPLEININTYEDGLAGSSKSSKSLRYFIEGLSLQFTNPKAVFFFMSIFPQFIDSGRSYLPQFSLLVLTYSGLVMAIHCVYFLAAQKAKNWITSPRGGNAVRKMSGAAFIFFGIMLARANR